jgi:OH-DDVA oxygenase
LFGGSPPPLIPILVNTYRPLNTPSPIRCLALGQALRRAIATLDPELRVAVIASGGLSHFLCEEEFDRDILEKLEQGRSAELANLPEAALKSGTSEVRSWIVLAGVVGDQRPDWTDYVPVHRTPVGTGIGMAFATWSGPSI